MFSTKRLKKKSQSVDIPDEGYAGSLLTDPLASPIIPSVSRAAIAEETESSVSNIQKSRSPRRGELKRGYTIDAGQKRSALERKDVRRISFQRPRGTMEYVVESRDTLNSIALKFDTTPNELVQLNKLFSRAVVPGKVLYVPDPEYMSSADSSPSLSPISPLSPSSSEADLDKTAADSDDVRRRQSAAAHGPPRHARVVSSTSEEEEALTEKFLKMNCKYITDGKGAVSGILLVTPNNIMFDPHKSDRVVQQRGCEEYGIMCPLEEVQSAAMCREVTDARVRELVPADLQLEACAGELSHVKRTPRLDNDSTSTAPRSTEASLSEEVFTESEDEPPQVRPSQTVLTISRAQPQPPQENATPDATSGSPGSHAEALEGPAEDPDTPQDTCDTQEAQSSSPANQIKAEEPHSTEPGRCRSHRFLCLRVGRAMRKTFLSHASASMQQYAQRDRKHEYWFAVPAERSDHLYAFFIQWTPDMYGEGLLGGGREPGFVVVKKNQSQTPDPESADPEKPSPDITFKDWEITTKEEVNSKLLLKSEPEPESFRPSLTQPSDLLQPDQIEKLAKHLPPRTIGYPWSLAFSTSQHGMSIKSLYRSMQELDSPVLMVIKDSEGQMFGALASEPLKVSDGFYGTGETFLFTFSPDLQVFKWTGDNLFFMKGDMDSVAFGGGGGEFGLWLDGDLYHGRTSSCKTFNSPMLSQTEDFYVQDIEIWAFE